MSTWLYRLSYIGGNEANCRKWIPKNDELNVWPVCREISDFITALYAFNKITVEKRLIAQYFANGSGTFY